MTHRERVMAALKHQPPDRVPLDFGATTNSTINAHAHARLREHLGIPREPPAPIVARRSTIVFPDEVILRRFQIDTRPLLLGSAENRPDREISPEAFVDEWGVTWTRHLGSHYIFTDGPFYRLTSPTVQDLNKFSWPDPSDPGRYRGLRARANELREQGYAVVLSLGAGPVHQAQFMRGYGEWLEDLLVNPAFAEGIMEETVDFWVEVATRALTEVGDLIEIVNFGDDIGTQRQPLVRPETYRKMIKPQHRRIAAAVKRFDKPLLFHTCGSVYALIPDLLDIGVDALNPVQVSAAEMDTQRLKREFGQDLTFWGAVDTQNVIPRGTPETVRAEVKRRLEDLAGGGGYVLCAVHNIQAEVPPENVVAMYEAALEYGK